MISPGVMAAAMLLGFAPPSPSPSPHCRDVRGTIATQSTTAGCTSALGCFSGELKTNSPLRGSTFFEVTSATPIPGTSSLQYTGTLIVTLPSGMQATFASTGTVDTQSGTYTETDVLVSPTPRVSGTLTSSGTVSPTLSSFSGSVTGSFCVSPPALESSRYE